MFNYLINIELCARLTRRYTLCSELLVQLLLELVQVQLDHLLGARHASYVVLSLAVRRFWVELFTFTAPLLIEKAIGNATQQKCDARGTGEFR